jgi:hypothetical protein
VANAVTDFLISFASKSYIFLGKKVVLKCTTEGKRKRGRPKTTWRCTIENEIKERIHLGHNRKKSQQQRRVEEPCPCPMCHEA